MSSNEVSETSETSPDAVDAEATKALVRATQRGDRQAFRALYEQYRQRVFRTAYRLLGRREQAEDVTQEVFVTLFHRLDSFDHRSAFTTWLYRITVNACYDVMRKQERRAKYRADDVDLHTVENLPLGSARADEDARQREVQHYVERALGRLGQELRTTFVLREMEGLPYEEIARVLDVSQGTVASRLARARQQLAEVLRGIGIDESYFE